MSGLSLLDTEKLHALPSEQQDLVLLTHVGDLEGYVKNQGSHQELTEQQGPIVQEILKVVNLPVPVSNRAIRASLGRCFYHILEKGDRKPLYEAINQLLEVVNAPKKALSNRHAATYCLGKVYKAAGDSAISLVGVCCSSLIKLSKSSQNHAGLRAAISRALGELVVGTKGSIDEATTRDVWKYTKNVAATDKSGVAQAKACWCLEQLIRETRYFLTLNDFESLKTTLWKTSDSSWRIARRASASCLAATFVQLYSKHADDVGLIKTKKPKKSGKPQDVTQEDIDEEESRPTSPSKTKDKSRLQLNYDSILQQLSTQYVRSSTSNRSRVVIARCYVRVFKTFESSLVSQRFTAVADHLLFDVVSHPHLAQNRHRLLLTRRLLKNILVNCICSRVLGESGQLDAARSLLNNVVKNYPSVIKEKPEPPKQALIAALDTIASLMKMLGPAFSPVADLCRETLLQVLQHTSYSVQIHASHCLKELALSCPQQLIPCASICMNSVSRELSQLTTGRYSPRRCVGYANGLAAVLSISGLRPLFGSLDINARVLSIATELLKSSGQAELRVASTQIQVAWILIGGLMALGPTFVKIHVFQFLMLWRNALPKHLKEANAGQRQLSELIFLTHLKESTLGSILSFLEYNTKLITADVAQKIAAMLQNTVEFLDTFSTKVPVDETSQRTNFSLNLSDLILMVRRRILQCFNRLLRLQPTAVAGAFTQSSVLIMALATFADPEGATFLSLEAAIANSAGNFESIWEISDNSAFGVCGFVEGYRIKPLPFEKELPNVPRWLEDDEDFDVDEAQLLSPILGALEHDSANVSTMGDLPDPPATEVTNSSIALFALALPLQTPKVQEAILEQLAGFLKSPNFQRNPGRKAAVMVNVAFALLATLKVAAGEISATAGDLRNSSVEKCFEKILKELVIDSDYCVRILAQEAFGRLCNSSGNAMTGFIVNSLVDTIIANRDPHARAGCAMSLGSIHSQLGGMAAGLHLQKIHGILMSLCSDANPIVHFAAANALSSVIDSAGLAFSGYISPSLGLVSSLWTSDSHNKESPSLSTSNTESELPTPIVVASLVDSLVNVLGPDLQHATKARDLILRLTKQFRYDGSIGVELESLRILEHFYLYDSKHVDLRAYVNSMQTILANPSSTVHRTAVDGIYNLAQRDISVVFDTSEKNFEERLWTALNQDPGQEGIRNIIRTWLRQSALAETGLWISRLHQVLTAVASQETEPTAPITNEENGTAEVQDEEVAGFAVSDGQQQKSTINTTAMQERLKWQVRDFALECLSELVTTVGKEIETAPPSEAGQALQQRISEIIRLAFLASTASVVELRVKGMRLIDQVLTIFGSTPDPEFSEALLLEQYQAQISSALTPAFGADSSPELAAAAIKVCATFIATGLVTDVDRMGRILKSLVTALDSFAADSQIVTIGDLKGLSTNAQIMIRMSVLIAWAELQVASAEHDYLVKVIEPHLQKLIPLWLSSLQEFARLRFEPDISSSMGPVRMDEGVDVVYASMNRQTLLKFYQESWLKLVDAIASLIDQDSDFVFEALDGNPDSMPLNGDRHYSTRVNYRDQPSAFFFVLFGIAIEALVTQSNSAEASTLSILLALKKILRPSVSGNAMFREAVFTESIEIFGRLALTEAFEVQNVVVDIVRNLCLSHPSAITQSEVHDGNITDDVEQLFELARIIVLILTRNVPNLSEQAMPSQSIMAEDAVSLIQSSLNALVDASAIFPSVIRNDLYACIFHIFATILGTAACQAAAVPKSLPIFKRFLQSIAVEKSEILGEAEASGQLIGCLTRFVLILSNAQRWESEASLLCAKNTLLAMTILVTTTSRSLPPTSPLITKVLDEMLDCLGDVGLAKVSAGCLRSLLLNSPKTETDEVIALHLIPRLLHFATDFQYPDPEAVRPILTQALTSFAISPASSPSLPDTQAATYCLILPAILCRAAHEGEAWYKEVASRILELASADQSTFKGVVQKLEPEQKSFLEKIIRESGIGATGKEGTGKRASREVAEEPTIALKFNFGAGQE